MDHASAITPPTNPILAVWWDAYKGPSPVHLPPQNNTISLDVPSANRGTTTPSTGGGQERTPYRHPLNSFKPFPSNVKEDDFIYLRKKDALSVPPRAIVIECLQKFAQHVHCQMPILDLGDIERII